MTENNWWSNGILLRMQMRIKCEIHTDQEALEDLSMSISFLSNSALKLGDAASERELITAVCMYECVKRQASQKLIDGIREASKSNINIGGCHCAQHSDPNLRTPIPRYPMVSKSPCSGHTLDTLDTLWTPPPPQPREQYFSVKQEPLVKISSGSRPHEVSHARTHETKPISQWLIPNCTGVAPI